MVTLMVTLMFNGGRMVMLWRWPLYWRENGQVRGGQFSGERMVMLQRWSVECRENNHVRDFVRLMEGE